MSLTRRGLLGGLLSLVATPAIVRAASLMPVRATLVSAQMIDLEAINRIVPGLPPSAGALEAELAAIVRRAFIPRVYVQIYQSAPLMAAALSTALNANGGEACAA